MLEHTNGTNIQTMQNLENLKKVVLNQGFFIHVGQFGTITIEITELNKNYVLSLIK